jgi:hypothetical protein
MKHSLMLMFPAALILPSALPALAVNVGPASGKSSALRGAGLVANGDTAVESARFVMVEQQNKELRKSLTKADVYQGTLWSNISDLERRTAQASEMEEKMRKLRAETEREEEKFDAAKKNEPCLLVKLRNASHVADSETARVRSMQSSLDLLRNQNKELMSAVTNKTAALGVLRAQLLENNHRYGVVEKSLRQHVGNLRRQMMSVLKKKPVLERKLKQQMFLASRQGKILRAQDAELRLVESKLRNVSLVADTEAKELVSAQSQLDSLLDRDTDLLSSVKNSTVASRALVARLIKNRREYAVEEDSTRNHVSELQRELASAKETTSREESEVRQLQDRESTEEERGRSEHRREQATEKTLMELKKELSSVTNEVAIEKERNKGLAEFTNMLGLRLQENARNATREMEANRGLTHQEQGLRNTLTLLRRRSADDVAKQREEKQMMLGMKARLETAEAEISQLHQSTSVQKNKAESREEKVRLAVAKARNAEEQRDAEKAMLEQSRRRLGELEKQYMVVEQELGKTYAQKVKRVATSVPDATVDIAADVEGVADETGVIDGDSASDDEATVSATSRNISLQHSINSSISEAKSNPPLNKRGNIASVSSEPPQLTDELSAADTVSAAIAR